MPSNIGYFRSMVLIFFSLYHCFRSRKAKFESLSKLLRFKIEKCRIRYLKTKNDEKMLKMTIFRDF